MTQSKQGVLWRSTAGFTSLALPFRRVGLQNLDNGWSAKILGPAEWVAFVFTVTDPRISAGLEQ